MKTQIAREISTLSALLLLTVAMAFAVSSWLPTSSLAAGPELQAAPLPVKQAETTSTAVESALAEKPTAVVIPQRVLNQFTHGITY